MLLSTFGVLFFDKVEQHDDMAAITPTRLTTPRKAMKPNGAPMIHKAASAPTKSTALLFHTVRRNEVEILRGSGIKQIEDR